MEEGGKRGEFRGDIYKEEWSVVQFVGVEMDEVATTQGTKAAFRNRKG